MAERTARGESLARDLERRTGEWPDVGTCSLIARDAVRLHHLAEGDCNGPPQPYGSARQDPEGWARYDRGLARWEARQEKATAEAEARVRARVESLGYRVTFQGDPRGAPFAILTDPDDDVRDVNRQRSAVWVAGSGR